MSLKNPTELRIGEKTEFESLFKIGRSNQDHNSFLLILGLKLLPEIGFVKNDRSTWQLWNTKGTEMLLFQCSFAYYEEFLPW